MMTCSECLRASWYVVWRHAVFFALCFAGFGLTIGLFTASRAQPSPAAPWVPFVVVAILAAGPLWFSPWVMRLLLQRRFRGFRFEMARTPTGSNEEVSYRESLRMEIGRAHV